MGQRSDFIALDVDDLETRPTRMALGLRNRSHYALLDTEQNIISQWFGPLNEASLTTELESHLQALGF